jgi:hypothetical protein
MASVGLRIGFLGETCVGWTFVALATGLLVEAVAASAALLHRTSTTGARLLGADYLEARVDEDAVWSS